MNRNCSAPGHVVRKSVLGLMVIVTLGFVAFCSRAHNETSKINAAENATDADSRERTTLLLNIFDESSGKPTAARFSLLADGRPFFPETVGKHGLRFVSIHESKKQTYVVTYARGTGRVEISLPKKTQTVEVHAAKGFEFLPVSVKTELTGPRQTVDLKLRRWIDPAKTGWTATDEHVHYDRLQPAGDQDWLTMLEGDGLKSAHFMVLKGGKVPGVWARQHSYGKDTQADDGVRWIRSGEEYRDSAQGHINLLGLNEVIQPISTGGLGKPATLVNYPPLSDVFRRNRELGGFAGVAHGGSLGRHPTAILDTVLGNVDFFEIANAHLYSRDLWYRLLNCGYQLPPAAGTDLPNYPYRDNWQPFLGSMRMYVRSGNQTGFDAWKRAVTRGEVYITSGPIISFSVNSVGPGKTIKLPAGGGKVRVEAEIATPIGWRNLEVIRNGVVVPMEVKRARIEGVDRGRISHRLEIDKSCWLAARGRGVPIKSLVDSISGTQPWIETDAVAHSAAIRVEVGGEPIRSSDDADELIKTLTLQREYYRTKGRYQQAEHRLRMLDLFETAIAKLEKRH